MNQDELRQMIEMVNDVSLQGMRAGQEIERIVTKPRIKRLESDILALVLRLYGEPEDSFSPEVAEVMARWKPRAAALLNDAGSPGRPASPL